jgi:arginyl-tRNA synthetase
MNETIAKASEKFEPQILPEYLRTLAAAFHGFYHECRIIGSDDELLQARLALAETTRYALRNGLAILGINAPEKM